MTSATAPARPSPVVACQLGLCCRHDSGPFDPDAPLPGRLCAPVADSAGLLAHTPPPLVSCPHALSHSRSHSCLLLGGKAALCIHGAYGEFFLHYPSRVMAPSPGCLCPSPPLCAAHHSVCASLVSPHPPRNLCPPRHPVWTLLPCAYNYPPPVRRSLATHPSATHFRPQTRTRVSQPLYMGARVHLRLCPTTRAIAHVLSPPQLLLFGHTAIQSPARRPRPPLAHASTLATVRPDVSITVSVDL